MNKEEKKLAKKILDNYYSKSSEHLNFTHEENVILDRWEAHKIINMDGEGDKPFYRMTSGTEKVNTYARGAGYPLTLLGYKEYTKNWYIQLRESMLGITIRDIFTIVALALSLGLTILRILEALQ